MTLSRDNTYTGATVVEEGILLVAASAAALGTTAAGTTVSSGATLDVQADIGTEAINVGGTGVNGIGALFSDGTGTVGGTVTLTDDTSIGSYNSTLNIHGTVAAGAFTLNTLGSGVINFGAAINLTSVTSLAVRDGTTNVNSALSTAGNAVVVVTDTLPYSAPTRLRFGSVSQTLSSLTIGAGTTVVFTSGTASCFLSGDDKGTSIDGFAVVPEPGTIGLLLVGALGVLNRRRRA